jgi:hypothetical protein
MQQMPSMLAVITMVMMSMIVVVVVIVFVVPSGRCGLRCSRTGTGRRLATGGQKATHS